MADIERDPDVCRSKRPNGFERIPDRRSEVVAAGVVLNSTLDSDGMIELREISDPDLEVLELLRNGLVRHVVERTEPVLANAQFGRRLEDLFGLSGHAGDIGRYQRHFAAALLERFHHLRQLLLDTLGIDVRRRLA